MLMMEDIESDSEVAFKDTLTPVSLNGISESREQACPKVFGRLFSTRLYLESLDLVKDVYLFGRNLNCNIIFSPKNFSPPKAVQFLSKVHFKITCENGNAFIENLSKNGTFLNGVTIGDQKVVLQNDDEISIGVDRLSVYVFKKFKNEKDSYLPLALQQKYVISRLLGEGAFGEVRLAFGKNTGEQYAIKRVINGRNSVDNFNGLNGFTNTLNEVKILKSLSHPFIISMCEVLETETSVFIVLEYMDGGDLTKHIISNNPLTEERTKLIFYQIALGVQYLHKKGITHRDLKPGNILLKYNEPETLVKVSDFGLSKIVHDNVFMATICGTPMFVAPEIVDNTSKSYTEQIDIWSLGVILFYMLSQELPFKAQHQSELFALIISGKYKMNSNKWTCISDGAKSIVQKMLVKDPLERIGIGEVAKHYWLQDNKMQETVKKLIKENEIEKSTLYLNGLRKQNLEETRVLM